VDVLDPQGTTTVIAADGTAQVSVPMQSARIFIPQNQVDPKL
jgi:hypothetical protein